MKVKSMTLSQAARFAIDGSVLQGTLRGRGVEIETQITIESDEPRESIARLVAVGEQSCFAMQSVANSVPCRTTVTLNGQPFDLAEAAR